MHRHVRQQDEENPKTVPEATQLRAYDIMYGNRKLELIRKTLRRPRIRPCLHGRGSALMVRQISKQLQAGTYDPEMGDKIKGYV